MSVFVLFGKLILRLSYLRLSSFYCVTLSTVKLAIVQTSQILT